MELRDALVAAVDTLIAGGAIEKQIKTAIEKTVGDVISDTLRPYSDFGTQLKEAVKKSFAIGTLDLPSYSDAILKIVRKQVEHATADSIQRQVADQLKDLLEPPPEQITLSALVEKFIEQVKEERDDGCGCHDEGEITLLVDEAHGFTYICLDDEPNKERYECGIRIGISRDTVFSVHLGTGELEKKLFVGPFYGFEKMLFQMAAARTRVVFDVDVHSIETHYEMNAA